MLPLNKPVIRILIDIWHCLSAGPHLLHAWLISFQITMMTELADDIITKTTELENELKHAGLWQKDIPAWVHWFDEGGNIGKTDFTQWLQFVFIPNHLHKNKIIAAAEKKLLVPHALKYFGNDLKKGKLLQILIEIDALL